MRHSTWFVTKIMISGALFCALTLPSQIATASAATPPQLSLNVLLIGTGSSDPTTLAWSTALTSEGVAFTEVTATGSYGAETVTLPALSSGTTGNFNAVVFADAPNAFAAGQFTTLDSYESTFGVRQLDGYMFPDSTIGLTGVPGAEIDGQTATVTAAGLVGLPQLKGTFPFDTGTYGYGATVNASAPFTPWITDSEGVVAGVYQHPSTDAQAGVSELALFFDYNYSSLQWLLLAPGLINWVTNDTHLGLYRNYFGQDVDDNFLADNEWSSADQCTPAATDPTDVNCSAAVLADPSSWPKDVQMSAADVDYVVAWEKANGITLNLAFNGVGACTAPAAGDFSSAVCNGTITDNGTTYTLPGDQIDSSDPNDAALVNELLLDKADFNWVIHTWSHEYLGCNLFQPQAVTSVVPNATGGTFSAGNYSYEITAATAYGESEPSLPDEVSVANDGSVTLTWPDATNGVGSNGLAGPTLAQEEAIHTGGTGFWGYNIYRTASGGSSYGLIGQVPENGTQATYTFTDTGAAAPGAAPGSSDANPTATNPGIDCASGLGASGTGNWDPVSDPAGSPDNSIDTEIAWDQAWAAANNLPNYSPSVVVTGEHSGIESPNMPDALANVGVTTFATDASRQPTQYSLSGTAGSITSSALSAPRYPSNIYYNASNWPDEINEYDTLYVTQGDSLGAAGPGEVGHCNNTSSTTCTATPPTEATILASESRIMLSHVLANDPRVGFAHQTNLIGDVINGTQQGYTLLSLLSDMLSQYNTWTNTPLVQMTDITDAQTLALQSAWSSALATGKVAASEVNGIITVTNNSGSPVSVPVTAPLGTTAGAGAYGQSYGGALSQWTPLANGATLTLSSTGATSFTSATSATSTVGTPFSFSVTTSGPVPALSESGALPTGIKFTDNANGTASLAGTPAAGTGGSFPITITAKSAANTVTQSFVLTNDQAPTITSANAASFTTGVSGTFTVTATGYPVPTVSESGTLPTGVKFTAGAAGTGTISGIAAPGSLSSYAVTLSASNGVGSPASSPFTLTVVAPSAPKFTSAASATAIVGSAFSFNVTTTGNPAATVTKFLNLPSGLTFTANANGTATISGTPTVAGTTLLLFEASNSAGIALQIFSLSVDQAPSFTSANSTTVTHGKSFSFQVSATGTPDVTFSINGTLPAGVTLTNSGGGFGFFFGPFGGNGDTATLSGTPKTAGTYTFNIVATNSAGSATQSFTLKVT